MDFNLPVDVQPMEPSLCLPRCGPNDTKSRREVACVHTGIPPSVTRGHDASDGSGREAEIRTFIGIPISIKPLLFLPVGQSARQAVAVLWIVLRQPQVLPQ